MDEKEIIKRYDEKLRFLEEQIIHLNKMDEELAETLVTKIYPMYRWYKCCITVGEDDMVAYI